MKIAYLLKKFPRLSETFILNEILEQEQLGTEVHVFSRRKPDEEPCHPQLARLRAKVEVLPTSGGMKPWLELFGSVGEKGGENTDQLLRFGALVRELADLEHPKLPTLFAEALYLLRRTRELGIDHVHVHFATDSALTAMLLSELGGPGYSVTAHAKDIYRSTVDLELLDRILRGSRFTVTVCDANLSFIRQRVSAEAGQKVRRLYNGIDLAAFDDGATQRDPLHVLSVGRLVEKKGFQILIPAIAILRRRGIDVRATLVGEGDYRPEIERLVAEHELGQHVKLTGPLDVGAVREMMRKATLFCLPCIVGADGNRDALPTVLLEALASGLPSVSTPVTGIPEILDHEGVGSGGAGIIVPESDSLATADAMQALLADDGLRASLAESGRRRATELFDGRRSAGQLRDWFAEVLDGVVCA